MSDLEQILWTSSATILGGLLLLVAGELLTRFVIEPLHEQRKVVGDIVDALIFYADVYSNPPVHFSEHSISTAPGPPPPSPWHDASSRLRQLAALLRARTYQVPAYGLLVHIRLATPRADVEEASSALIGLSNMTIRGDGMRNHEKAKRVRALLRVPVG